MAEVNRVQVTCQIFQACNNNLLSVLFELTSCEVKTARHWPGSLLHFHRPRLYPGGGGGGYTGFQVTGMIKWGQKSQCKKKIPGPKIKPQNIPCRISQPQKISRKYYLIKHTHTKKESRLKSSHLKKYFPNFLVQKNPGIENSNPKKSFDHPRHLKLGAPAWCQYQAILSQQALSMKDLLCGQKWTFCCGTSVGNSEEAGRQSEKRIH